MARKFPVNPEIQYTLSKFWFIGFNLRQFLRISADFIFVIFLLVIHYLQINYKQKFLGNLLDVISLL